MHKPEAILGYEDYNITRYFEIHRAHTDLAIRPDLGLISKKKHITSSDLCCFSEFQSENKIMENTDKLKKIV